MSIANSNPDSLVDCKVSGGIRELSILGVETLRFQLCSDENPTWKKICKTNPPRVPQMETAFHGLPIPESMYSSTFVIVISLLVCVVFECSNGGIIGQLIVA